MKNGPVAAELFRAGRKTDEWTDRYNDANCPFSQFCEGV
jgi:hypothetical protein